MGNQICCHLPQAWFCAHQCFQCCPSALGPLSSRDVVYPFGEAFGFIGEQGIHRCIDVGQQWFLERQFGKAGFVVDRHRGTVFHRLLNVVDGDVVAEDRLGVTVVLGDGRAREGKEGRLGQGIPQRLCQPVVDLPCFGVEATLESVLAAVCLVADHHDVVALAQGRELPFPCFSGELLNGGEEDAAAGAVGEQFPEFLTTRCLPGGFTQQVSRPSEHPEQLPIQILTVGDDHQGGVLQAWIPQQHPSQTRHLDALASALGVPDHPTLLVAIRAAGFHHPLNGRTNGVELVVGGDLLDDLPVVLKQAEGAHELQQAPLVKDPPHQGFEIAVSAQWIEVVLPFDGAPALKPFPIGTQGSHPCLDAIADHQQHVGREQVGDVLLVGLQLVERCPDVCLLIGRVLEFDHRQRQTVDVDHHIRAAVVLAALDRQLVHHQPVVGGGVVEADDLEADAHLLVPIHVGDG